MAGIDAAAMGNHGRERVVCPLLVGAGAEAVQIEGLGEFDWDRVLLSVEGEEGEAFEGEDEEVREVGDSGGFGFVVCIWVLVEVLRRRDDGKWEGGLDWGGKW